MIKTRITFALRLSTSKLKLSIMNAIILANFLLWVDQSTYLLDCARYTIDGNLPISNEQLAELYAKAIESV